MMVSGGRGRAAPGFRPRRGVPRQPRKSALVWVVKGGGRSHAQCQRVRHVDSEGPGKVQRCSGRNRIVALAQGQSHSENCAEIAAKTSQQTDHEQPCAGIGDIESAAETHEVAGSCYERGQVDRAESSDDQPRPSAAEGSEVKGADGNILTAYAQSRAKALAPGGEAGLNSASEVRPVRYSYFRVRVFQITLIGFAKPPAGFCG
jgi:hypothetical protein